MKKLLYLFILAFIFSLIGCATDNNSQCKSGHTWNLGVLTENPEGGDKMVYTCSVCGETKTDELGEMKIEDLILYTNFPNKPIITFTNPNYAVGIDEMYVDYDSNAISFDGEYFEALIPNQTVTVTIETQYHKSTFTITTKDYLTACGTQDFMNFYLEKAKEKENVWKKAGSPTNGTIFMGDSFFDTQFWSNFYDLYKGNNAFTTAISSATSTDWEIWVGRLLYPMKPKNIVIHIGSNNLWDDYESPQTAVANLERLYDTICHHLPETKIYCLPIEPRTYGIGGGEFTKNTYNSITFVNNAIEEYCEENEHAVFVDATSHCYSSGIIVDENFFRDGGHPKLENYMYYVYALRDAGLELTINEGASDPKPEVNNSSMIFTTSMNVGNSIPFMEDGRELAKEFSVKGNILVSEALANAHLSIAFNLDANNRLLLHDHDNNGSLTVGYACNGTYMLNQSTKGVKLNEKVSFELFVTTNNAYLYINDELVMVFLQTNPNSVVIGTEGCAVALTDLVIINKGVNLTGYNALLYRDEVSEYENGNYNSKQVIIK